MPTLTPDPIQIKRGVKAVVMAANLADGELAFCTDTKEVVISDGTNKTIIRSIIVDTLANRPITEEEQRFFFSSDTNQLFIMNSGSWAEIGNQLVLQVFNPRLSFEIMEDWVAGAFSGSYGWSRSQANGGNATATSAGLTSSHKGLMSLQANGTDARCCLYLGNVAMFMAGGPLRLTMNVYLSALSTSPEEYTMLVGLGDSTSTDTDVDAVLYKYSSASPNWICRTVNDSTATEVDSGIAVVATTWVILEFRVNNDGTQVDFYIDGSYVSSITTNIPNSSARVCAPNIRILKTAGSGNVYFVNDYFHIQQHLTTAR